MKLTSPQQRINSLIKWSSVFLPISLLLLLASIWSGPFSPTYLLISAMFGIVYTVLVLAYSRLKPDPLLYALLFISSIVLLTLGRYWAQDWAFPDIHHFYWGIALQYIGVVFTVFFLTAFVMRFFFRKNVRLERE